MIALIPARAGSARIPNKNIKPLAGHPLIAYTIAAAKESECFSDVWVCTDSHDVIGIAIDMDCTPMHRTTSAPTETDYQWISRLTLPHDDDFCLLRPTSPFRGAETIQRAVKVWTKESDRWDSLRTIRPASEHPGKMWVTRHNGTVPLLGLGHGHQPDPWHSMPTQDLPQVYVQTAGLEIAHVSMMRETQTIAGSRVRGLCLNAWEGFDINTPDDWIIAEHHAREGDWPLVVPNLLTERPHSRDLSS